MDAFYVPKNNKFSFHGDGGSLFKLYVPNFFLTLITLGLYYPWAKAAFMQYFYQQTELSGNRFGFHGTGKEMFTGMLKSIALLLILGGLAGALYYFYRREWVCIALFGLSILALLPFATVGSLRYRLSRSSWRGIHFGYRGEVKDMSAVYIKGALLSILTFGIYIPWLLVSKEKESKINTRMGDLELDYDGLGGTYFGKLFIGYTLTTITSGIYFPWRVADLHNYRYNNTYIYQQGKTSRLHSTVTGSGLFKLNLINFLIIFFTLGFGYAWTAVRSAKYYCENLSLEGDIDLSVIQQTELAYTDATGEELAAGFDLNVI